MNEEKLVVDKLLQNATTDIYMKMIDMKILELKPGYCKSMLKVSANVKNPYDSVHGGCLYSLADITSGYASCAFGNYVSTISGTMNYIRPAINTEYVYCEATVVRQGKTVSIYNVELFDDNNEILENGTFNFYTLHRKIIEA